MESEVDAALSAMEAAHGPKRTDQHTALWPPEALHTLLFALMHDPVGMAVGEGVGEEKGDMKADATTPYLRQTPFLTALLTAPGPAQAACLYRAPAHQLAALATPTRGTSIVKKGQLPLTFDCL